ncbi:maf protein [Naegleria gruberi]|uniref:Maf protein n=1 Tax=Naegleria gruberi TaxID=5762 RepID=D2VQK7_NAEGR|nr:maf protein [Naegleria gruberi]EFC40887.1 maf protein [Naegleria gruberi]|eukprot:XP_002673631.1 maf protein [Naegleria gruberi]
MLRKLVDKYHVVLASQSPRRKKILIENGGLEFEKDFVIIPSTFDEKSLDKSKFETPNDFVMENSRLKAEQVFNSMKDSFDNLIVIGSDSIVVYGKEILEKPASTDEARNMLNMLSGNKHKVISGVSIYIKNTSNCASEPKLISFASETLVLFDTLSAELIEEYIETKEPMDKAGAYGIQDMGSAFVLSIEGDYHTVMGLPYQKTFAALRLALHK